MDIIFSIKPKNLAIIRPMNPIPITVNLKLLRSALVIDRVNNKHGAILRTKITPPIKSCIQLLKGITEIAEYDKVAAIADERSIFADDAQSTVTP